MERFLLEVAIMIEAACRHTKCTPINSDCSQMLAIAQPW